MTLLNIVKWKNIKGWKRDVSKYRMPHSLMLNHHFPEQTWPFWGTQCLQINTKKIILLVHVGYVYIYIHTLHYITLHYITLHYITYIYTCPMNVPTLFNIPMSDCFKNSIFCLWNPQNSGQAGVPNPSQFSPSVPYTWDRPCPVSGLQRLHPGTEWAMGIYSGGFACNSTFIQNM